MFTEMIIRMALTLVEIFLSPALAIVKCVRKCWEDTAPVSVRIGDHTGTLRVGSFNACLFQGVSDTSLARVKASLAKIDRFLTDAEMATLPGGKVRKISVDAGTFKPQVEAKILKAIGVKPVAEKK